MASQDTSVVLIGHGGTEYNRTGRYMGRLEKGLNDLGREQAASPPGGWPGRAVRRF